MIRSKKCFKCNAVQPLSEFYAHSAMADGHINKCKTCAKKDVLIHRGKNLEKIRAYDRKRGKLAHRIALRAIVTKAWRAEDKRRSKAHNAVRKSILNGKLYKANCAKCNDAKSVAHHEDYDKTLQIIWLCTICHKQRHKEIKANSNL
jgi:hypothetical protein